MKKEIKVAKCGTPKNIVKKLEGKKEIKIWKKSLFNVYHVQGTFVQQASIFG
jgi:hypothetical protein